MQRRVGIALIVCAASILACGDDDSGDVADAAPADAPVTVDATPGIDAVPPPDAAPPLTGNTCVTPFDPGVAAVTDSQDTSAEFTNAFVASCSLGTNAHPDAVYRIPLGETPVDFIAIATVDETAKPPYDAVLSARTACQNAGTELACADTGLGERLEVLGASGDVFLIVDGTEQFGLAPVGAYDLTTTTRAIVAADAKCDPAGIASRCETGLRCDSGTCATEDATLACSQAVDLTGALAGGATAVVTGATHLYEASFFAGSCAADAEATFTEDLYTFTVGATSTLDASTDDPATDFDTVLYLLDGTCAGTERGCHDDVNVEAFNLRSHLVAPALAPGTYTLVVDGSSAAPGTGNYRLSVTLTAE